MPAETRSGVDHRRRHLRFGWWSLLVYTAFGLILETFHAFKVRAYLDVSNETRRLMWTLAHAHGTLLALVNVLFALTLGTATEIRPAIRQRISLTLIAASVLVPAGFLLGGFDVAGGDPGIGTIVLPVGAVLLLIALFWIARVSDAKRS